MPVAVTPARNSRCNSKRQVYRAGASKMVTKASGYQRGYQANRLPWHWYARKAMAQAMQVQAVKLSKVYTLRYRAPAVLT